MSKSEDIINLITSINRGKTGKCVTDLQYYLSQPAIDAYLIPVFPCYLRENKGKDLPFIGNLSLQDFVQMEATEGFVLHVAARSFSLIVH